MSTIRESKTTKTKSIANKIVNYLKNSKYLHFEEVEDYYDNRVRIRYDFNNDLVNQARDTMKNILQDILIDIFIEDYDGDIKVSILSTLGMGYDDWCESLNYTDDEELYSYLNDKLGDEALLDNAQNNDTWEENLKEDVNINQSIKGLKKKVVENKLQESRDFHNYKTQLEQAKSQDELIKIWNTFRKDYDSEMTPNEEKTLGELYKDLRKELKENWVQFTFEDGSNPYIAKTKEEQDRMFKKYKDRVEQVSDITYLVKKEKNLKEDKQVTYVWKKDGDDHILTEKGKDKALITLSRMNSSFPWTIYKGDKEITLDTDSDKLSDIKSYILKNIDKILGKKLKEGLYEFSKSDKKAIIQWWKDISKIEDDYVNISNIDKALENDDEFFNWFSAMYDVLNDLRYNTSIKDDEKRAYVTNLYKKGKRLYNKYAISQFNENLKEGADGNTIMGSVIKYLNQGLKDEEIIDKVSKELDIDKERVAWDLRDIHNSRENLKEAKGKLDDALPEVKEYINEYKDKIVEYGEALAKGEVARPNYKDYTTRFIYDIYWFLKGRGFDITKYVNEDDLQDKYIGTLMKKALSDCGVKITKDEYLNESLDTFNDKMDFLAKDEEEAIDGYKKVIKTIDNENVKAQLSKIEKEEKAHKDYLEKVKKNKNIKYTEPLMDEE